MFSKRKVKFEEVSDQTIPAEEFRMNPRMPDLETIKEAIQALPDGHRVILSLFLIEGYDHSEISQILGISSVASRVQLMRAKNKLKKILSDKEIFSYN